MDSPCPHSNLWREDGCRGESQSRILCYVNIINQNPHPWGISRTSVPLKTNSYHFLIYLVSRCLVKLKFQVSNVVAFVTVRNPWDKWMLKSSLWLVVFEVLFHGQKDSILWSLQHGSLVGYLWWGWEATSWLCKIQNRRGLLGNLFSDLRSLLGPTSERPQNLSRDPY